MPARLALLIGFVLATVTDSAAQVLTPLPRPSFDCAGASTQAERLICSDAQAATTDAEMAREYARLLRELSSDGARALRAAQRAFLAHVHGSCTQIGAYYDSDDPALRCLREALDDRARWYRSARIVSAGPLRIEPRYRFEGRKAQREEGGNESYFVAQSDAYPFAVAVNTAGRAPARAFNERIARLLKTDRPLLEAHFDQAMPDFVGTISRDFSLANADERLISLRFAVTVETGTAVPRSVSTLNWNVARNRPITPEDLFRPGSNWRVPFRAIAEARFADDRIRGYFLGEIETLKNWELTPEGLNIYTAWNNPRYLRGNVEDADCIGCPVKVNPALIAPFLQSDSPWRPVFRTP